jgi:HEAT repeat protein
VEKEFKSRLKAIVEQAEARDRELIMADIRVIREAKINTFDELLEVVSNEYRDQLVRTSACWVLSRLGDEAAIPFLSEALRSAEPNVRKSAAYALGHLKHPDAIPPLAKTLAEDGDNEVRTAVAYALGYLGDSQALEPLVQILQNPEEPSRLRGMTAEALANIGDHAAVGPLCDVLNDESVEVRYWAVFALGRVGDMMNLPQLERLAFMDAEVLLGWGSVKAEAAKAIRNIEERHSKRSKL